MSGMDKYRAMAVLLAVLLPFSLWPEPATPEVPREVPAAVLSQPDPAVLGTRQVRAPQVERFRVETLSRKQILALEKLYGTDPPVPYQDLRMVRVVHRDFFGGENNGYLTVHHQVAEEIREIFLELYQDGYPLEKVRPLEEYAGKDDASMSDNNSSAFCVRPVTGGTGYSRHSFGVAVDINPLMNPYVKGETVLPAEAAGYVQRGSVKPGMIVPGDACHQAFISRGWIWGGDWNSLKDYQHFEKPFSGGQP